MLAKDNNLILTGRNLSLLQQLQSELKAKHPWSYKIAVLDFSDSSLIDHFIDFLKQSDTLINGVVLIGPRPQFCGKEVWQEEEAWLEVFKTTFTGPLRVLKEAIPHLSSSCKIVVIAGTTSVQLQPDLWACLCHSQNVDNVCKSPIPSVGTSRH